MKEKLILKKNKDWGNSDIAIRIPAETGQKMKDLSAEVNIPIKLLCAELLEFALKNIEIVD